MPSVELRYERLKKEAATLEFDRANSARDFQQLNDHITMVSKTRDSVRLDYEKEMDRLRYLQQQRMKLEAGVKQFQNNNEEYVKIRNTVEEKVHSVSSDKKMVLKLALLSLTESMRKDPDRYTSLMYNSMSSISKTQSIGYSSNQHYGAASSRQQRYSSLDYISMLLEESEKLYDKLAKEWVDEIISNYASNTSSSLLLLLLLPSEEPQSHPTTTANQIHMHTEKHRFTQSEIDDDN